MQCRGSRPTVREGPTSRKGSRKPGMIFASLTIVGLSRPLTPQRTKAGGVTGSLKRRLIGITKGPS
jgi:hypothetical protein